MMHRPRGGVHCSPARPLGNGWGGVPPALPHREGALHRVSVVGTAEEAEIVPIVSARGAGMEHQGFSYLEPNKNSKRISRHKKKGLIMQKLVS